MSIQLFHFGKKKRKSRSKKVRKPPAKLLKMCKRFKIKCTKKVGKRRVYKSAAVLKKQLKRKMRKVRKPRRKARRVSSFGFSFGALKSRRSRFGAPAAYNNNVSDYGYNQSAAQNPGILSQTSQVVTAESNGSRPNGMQLQPGNIPTYGTNKMFFTESVPTTVPPEWFVMGQPGGAPPVPIGSPFYGYKTPFGRHKKSVRRRRRN
jgi:hypothetical protein